MAGWNVQILLLLLSLPYLASAKGPWPHSWDQSPNLELLCFCQGSQGRTGSHVALVVLEEVYNISDGNQKKWTLWPREKAA